MSSALRIAFVVHSLSTGGTERQCVTLALALASRGHQVLIFKLRGGGRLDRELDGSGVCCVDLSRHRPWYRPRALFDLACSLRTWCPDVVHSYLVVPNLLVAVLRPFLGRVAIVWGVRAASSGSYHRRAAFAVGRLAARVPQLIIVNSKAGRRYHIERGYPAHKMLLIENGIDCSRFTPDPTGRARMRAEWNIPSDAPLVGFVARPDPLKDHETFLRAAGHLARGNASVRFVCVGQASGAWFEAIDELARGLGLSGQLAWAQQHDDMTAVYNALDVGCLSSVSESFPNVVAEAMACGTPYVVTDVGDAAEIVSDTGVVVPPRDPQALADGVREMLARLADDRERARSAARDRIVRLYSVGQLVERTEEVLRDLHPCR